MFFRLTLLRKAPRSKHREVFLSILGSCYTTLMSRLGYATICIILCSSESYPNHVYSNKSFQQNYPGHRTARTTRWKRSGGASLPTYTETKMATSTESSKEFWTTLLSTVVMAIQTSPTSPFHLTTLRLSRTILVKTVRSLVFQYTVRWKTQHSRISHTCQWWKHQGWCSLWLMKTLRTLLRRWWVPSFRAGLYLCLRW